MDNTTRTGDFGYDIGGGRKATCFNGILHLSYELKENLYFDLTAQRRTYKIENEINQNNSTLVVAGIRLNIMKREYDY